MTPEQERELADALVELGIGERWPRTQSYGFSFKDSTSIHNFIREGRVVLAMMQKLSYAELIHALESSGLIDGSLVDEIELVQACVKALRGEG